MKKLTLFLLLSIFCYSEAISQKWAIDNPPVDFTKTGIRRITRIETDPHATRVYFLNEFVPGWWFTYSDKIFLEDEHTGRRYTVTAMEGGEFDKRIVTPSSGDSLIVLVFSPLDKEVKKVNYGNEDGISIWGVSLEKSRGRSSKNEKGIAVPPAVLAWIEQELGDQDRPGITPFDSPDFFRHDTARVVGYISGYDPRAGFSTGLTNSYNHITRETQPMVIEIEADGRFWVDLPLVHPQLVHLNLNNQYIPVYLEPGRTLGLSLTWEDFLRADRYRNRTYQFAETEYYGSLAGINRELLAFDPPRMRYKDRQKIEKENTPEGVYTHYRAFLDKNLSALAAIKSGLSEEAYRILTYREYENFGMEMLDYESNNRYAARKDPELPELPSGFYHFLTELPLNDPAFLTVMSSSFINRLEYVEPIRDARFSYSRLKPFPDYLREDTDAVLSAEDEQIIAFFDSLRSTDRSEMDSLFREEYYSKMNKLSENHKPVYAAYQAKYIDPIRTKTGRLRTDLEYMDKVYYEELNLPYSMIYDMIKVRCWSSLAGSGTRMESINMNRILSDAVIHPFVQDEVWRLFEQTLPCEDGSKYKELPAGKAADAFKKIVDPYKGGLVLVDFWATWCGPCVSGIRNSKDQRAELESSGQLTYVFITDESSPMDKYEEFVREQELKNVFRVDRDTWNLLKQLFKISGIPRYVLLDAQGRVLDDKFHLYKLEEELRKYE